MAEVSVIIPCYNHGRYIDQAVDSVLAQTFQDFEIIIINDGSTDDFTIKKLRSYDKPKCRVIHTVNRGLAAARNMGLTLATGRYIQFLDSDDVIEKNKFTLQLLQLRSASENALSYCDYFSSVENDLTVECPSRYLSPEFRTKDYVKELITNWGEKFSIPCHCFLFNSSIFKENKISFDEELPNHEDWECWMNIFALEPQVSYVNEKLAIYRIRPDAMCYNTELMKAGYIAAIQKQRGRYGKSTHEYLLLSNKYNQIKYGYYTENVLKALIFGLFKRIKRKARRLYSHFRQV